jgi:8-oxo-dGTP pyrophosphatase MutT (NUDIX family)
MRRSWNRTTLLAAQVEQVEQVERGYCMMPEAPAQAGVPQPSALSRRNPSADARGAMVVVYRRTPHNGIEVLMLHRAGRGPAYEGDWAWTPPAGRREPGETVTACARRELLEETSLELAPRPIGAGIVGWPVYVAEAAADVRVLLAQ